jgi:hypothetical protein
MGRIDYIPCFPCCLCSYDAYAASAPRLRLGVREDTIWVGVKCGDILIISKVI